MISGSRKTRSIPLYLTAGWLFAELLLGIAMVFLISSPGAPTTPPPTPTPTTPRPPTPTPTPQPLLDLQVQTIILSGVNTNGLVNGDASAVSTFQASVLSKLSQNGIGRQCAGLVLPYVGQNGNNNYITVGHSIKGALQALGSGASGGGAFFKVSRYHEPLLLVGQSNSDIKLEIYLYSSPLPCYPAGG
jgi:hypothetical protein